MPSGSAAQAFIVDSITGESRAATTADFTGGSFETFTEAQLTAPGVTTARSFSKWRRLSCHYTVAGIHTHVVVRVEGRLTSTTGWAPLTPNTTTTENGTHRLSFEGTVEDVRFNFVSESGGSNATIDVVFRFA